MTADVNLVAIADALSALQVSGVNVRDIDQIPENATNIVPVFFPIPNGFITDMVWERETFGADTVAKMNLTYVLHYRYLHAPIGSGGGLLAVYAGLIKNLVKILQAIFADSNLSGEVVDVSLNGISDIGALPDPAGNPFHGVDITLKVLEYIQ